MAVYSEGNSTDSKSSPKEQGTGEHGTQPKSATFGDKKLSVSALQIFQPFKNLTGKKIHFINDKH